MPNAEEDARVLQIAAPFSNVSLMAVFGSYSGFYN